MNADKTLDDLLSQWQREAGLGRDLPAVQLCLDRPELVAELERRIEALRRLDGLAKAAATSNVALVTELEPEREATVSNQELAAANVSAAWPHVPGYEIIGELGRGGMGVVYKARHVGLDRIVALKMVRGDLLADINEVQRFQTEAHAVARLKHGHIVQIYEIGNHNNCPYFSLEYCEGGSLHARLAGNPMHPGEAALLTEKVARAIDAAHQAKIIHRDLKPHNILLTDESEPKVSDFGLAKKLDSSLAQTRTGAVMGTPSYMAPEQARGEAKSIGPPCDIYGLGAILYECLTGRPPFKAADTWDTLTQVIEEDPVPPMQLNNKVPRDLETICLKCLRKEPAKRYATALDLAADLRRFQVGEPITARPVSRVERTLKWAKRKPARAALVTVCMLAGLVLLIAGWAFTSELQKREQNLANALQQTETANKADWEQLTADVRRLRTELTAANAQVAAVANEKSGQKLWRDSNTELLISQLGKYDDVFVIHWRGVIDGWVEFDEATGPSRIALGLSLRQLTQLTKDGSTFSVGEFSGGMILALRHQPEAPEGVYQCNWAGSVSSGFSTSSYRGKEGKVKMYLAPPPGGNVATSWITTQTDREISIGKLVGQDFITWLNLHLVDAPK